MQKQEIYKPEYLKKGEAIGIIAPAWTFDINNFKRGVDKLRSLGFRVKYERAIFSKYWSMAGYDRQRAEQVNRMFADNDVKAIFCAKAGYGSMRTIPYLDGKIIRANPKIFVGYSDITILLSFLRNVANMVVFHGQVVSEEIYEDMNPISLDYLLQAITKPQPLGEVKFKDLKSLRPGEASGVLTGGNLSMIMSAIGTPYDINTDNSILFLEDIGEGLEVVDNHLMHLKLSGKLRRIKGLVFGRMVDCFECSGTIYNIKNVIDDILGDVDVPIIYGFPSGHRGIGQINVTLPFGVSVTLDADKPRLIINEAGVK